ncbi:hypothetical protein BLNAU_5525 [Blattamonas nauphoetae]|uniref:Uncharacterized protein n=1 Tax=Blattamonas nauphoetae TaxID=2049346 RepID=A0ABQ9Y6V9_9EUKA|nr:hypothetical protein BLNAU_5525 [Blattamonas nauphoetae]
MIMFPCFYARPDSLQKRLRMLYHATQAGDVCGGSQERFQSIQSFCRGSFDFSSSGGINPYKEGISVEIFKNILGTFRQLDYIKPLELYCEKTQPCDVPTTLPKLLIVIGKTSEGERVRICESTIPSFILECLATISSQNILTEIGDCLFLWTSTLRSSSAFLANHKTHFLAFIDHWKKSESSIPHLTILAQLCFSPHLEMSKLTLKALSQRCETNSGTRSLLRKLSMPSYSTDNSSELVPFARRLSSALSKHVTKMKSLFTESSPMDVTISALSATLPEESPLLAGNTVLEIAVMDKSGRQEK